MPELPEVETIRRRLEADLCGARVAGASLHRRDMLRLHGSDRSTRRIPREAIARALLEGGRLVAFRRRGKQLAMEADDGRMVLVHLGMSGRLLLDRAAGVAQEDSGVDAALPAHAHVRWALSSRGGERRLLLVDPRRFGWVTAIGGAADLDRCWTGLGPDALRASSDQLAARLDRSRRPIKSLLLDQTVIAGLGNIYVAEVLHRVGVHPSSPAALLAPRAAELVAAIRRVLQRAIELGGSTIRDHRDPSGRFGSFQELHAVYGRHGRPCLRCAEAGRTTLVQRVVLGGRGTWFCSRCQASTDRARSGAVGLSTKRDESARTLRPTGRRALLQTTAQDLQARISPRKIISSSSS